MSFAELTVYFFAAMTCKYDLEMPENTWLVRQPKSSVNMYYVSGNCLDFQHVQEIEMKIISETQPSQRLKKLIQKGHLNEAEVCFFFKLLFFVFITKISYFRNLLSNLD